MFPTFPPGSTAGNWIALWVVVGAVVGVVLALAALWWSRYQSRLQVTYFSIQRILSEFFYSIVVIWTRIFWLFVIEVVRLLGSLQ